jgi:hypothetical protein
MDRGGGRFVSGRPAREQPIDPVGKVEVAVGDRVAGIVAGQDDDEPPPRDLELRVVAARLSQKRDPGRQPERFGERLAAEFTDEPVLEALPGRVELACLVRHPSALPFAWTLVQESLSVKVLFQLGSCPAASPPARLVRTWHPEGREEHRVADGHDRSRPN